MGKREFNFESGNGVDVIHAIIWTPDENKYKKPRAVVQISHGMIEYIDRYDDLAGYLTAQGFVVVGNDHLGHGQSVKSEDDWGYFCETNGSENIVKDLHKLTTIVKEQYEGIPYYLLGHSMGSFMARRYIMNYGMELDGIIIMGTGNQPKLVVTMGKVLAWVTGRVHGERYRSKLITRIMFGRYNKKIENMRTSNDWISSDENVVDKYNSNPACTFLFTVNGFKGLLDTISYIEKSDNITRIPNKLPVLILSGTADPVGNYGKDVQKVYNIYQSSGIEDVELKLYEGYRHEIHNEVGKAAVYSDISEWIIRHL